MSYLVSLGGVPVKNKTKNAGKGQDYTVHDPRGWCGNPARGAALGRHSYHARDQTAWQGKLYVSRVRLDTGGYDSNGTYFGAGEPLYWVRSADYEIDYMLRAPDNVLARAMALREYPMATLTRPLNRVESDRAARVLGEQK